MASGASEMPDYGFYVAGKRMFFLEAKKPKVDLDADPRPAWQLRRYAWNAGLLLSVLTDFEGLHIYDCSTEPSPTHDPRSLRLASWNWTDYESRWQELADTLSRSAVEGGSLSRLLAAPTAPGVTVDKLFLENLSYWRQRLAEDVWSRAAGRLPQARLPLVVQGILDRIIFLRIAEDRGTEDREQLLTLTKHAGVYDALLAVFRAADVKYNSGLFATGEESLDPEAPFLEVGDAALCAIIRGLYPPAPYEFSVMPVEILGKAYEHFLGRQIVVVANRPIIEEKPDVRKAGGVYYTPEWVVRTMVEETVGAALRGKSPADLTLFRCLDPACGSGSFLVGVFRYLLQWYLEWYVAHDPALHAKVPRAPRRTRADGPGQKPPAKTASPRLFRSSSGLWRLTVAAKSEILLQHVFGLDIDPAAVEVAKLSLLLVVLEGESEQVAQRALFDRRILPDLGANVLCGNSLVGTDIVRDYPQLQNNLATLVQINPFDWKSTQMGFGRVMASGAFDVVIGNPPYLSYSGRQAVELSAELRGYFDTRFDMSGWPTAHGLFIQQASTLSRGQVSFIVPDQVGHLAGYEPTRRWLSTSQALRWVRYWGESVFEGVTTPALSFVADGAHNGLTLIYDRAGQATEVNTSGGAPWVSGADSLLERLSLNAWSLASLVADPGPRLRAGAMGHPPDLAVSVFVLHRDDARGAVPWVGAGYGSTTVPERRSVTRAQCRCSRQ